MMASAILSDTVPCHKLALEPLPTKIKENSQPKTALQEEPADLENKFARENVISAVAPYDIAV